MWWNVIEKGRERKNEQFSNWKDIWNLVHCAVHWTFQLFIFYYVFPVHVQKWDSNWHSILWFVSLLLFFYLFEFTLLFSLRFLFFFFLLRLTTKICFNERLHLIHLIVWTNMFGFWGFGFWIYIFQSEW